VTPIIEKEKESKEGRGMSQKLMPPKSLQEQKARIEGEVYAVEF